MNKNLAEDILKRISELEEERKEMLSGNGFYGVNTIISHIDDEISILEDAFNKFNKI